MKLEQELLRLETLVSAQQQQIGILKSVIHNFGLVREKEDVHRIIRTELHGYNRFARYWIGTLESEGQSMRHFLLEPDFIANDHPQYQQIMRKDYPVNDGVFDKVLASSRPVVFDLLQYPAGVLPEYFRPFFECGITVVVMTALHLGAHQLGVLAICLMEESLIGETELSLFTRLGRQLSAVIADCKAGEAIRRREDENEKLLAFSTDLASATGPEHLLEIMRTKLKELLGFSDTALVRLENDKLIFPASTATYRMRDGVSDRAYASPSPMVFDLDALAQMGTIPAYLKTSHEQGARRVCIIRLLNGCEVLGFWFTWYDDHTPVGYDKTRVIEGLAKLLSVAVSGAKAHNQAKEIFHLQENSQKISRHGDIIGGSRTMQRVFHLISQVASSDSTVLILGETGTGKELIAKAIHQDSPRRNKLLVKVNCAALPANLIESELFGHERGSFTGAIERRIGKFELADGGTLFLDEIGEMPLELQVKLLRALQEREIERIGGKATIKVNTRIIAATNRDLEHEMLEGRFRSDLYYRLNIFPIELPPLRDRKEDIPQLAVHFIRRLAKKAGKQVETLSTAAMQEMMKYPWPGNVRELEHVLERCVLLTPGDTIRQVYLPAPRKNRSGAGASPKLLSIDENEREHIMNVIRYCGGRISGPGGAADILGVPASTLNSKMKRLGIKKAHVTSNSV